MRKLPLLARIALLFPWTRRFVARRFPAGMRHAGLDSIDSMGEMRAVLSAMGGWDEHHERQSGSGRQRERRDRAQNGLDGLEESSSSRVRVVGNDDGSPGLDTERGDGLWNGTGDNPSKRVGTAPSPTSPISEDASVELPEAQEGTARGAPARLARLVRHGPQRGGRRARICESTARGCGDGSARVPACRRRWRRR